jgi:hypothetical protein
VGLFNPETQKSWEEPMKAALKGNIEISWGVARGRGRCLSLYLMETEINQCLYRNYLYLVYRLVVEA